MNKFYLNEITDGNYYRTELEATTREEAEIEVDRIRSKRAKADNIGDWWISQLTHLHIDIAKWVDGQGWSYKTTIDNITDFVTAEEYIKALDPPITIEDGEDYQVTVYDDEGDELSSAWVSEVK